jgi:hypothetical protein
VDHGVRIAEVFHRLEGCFGIVSASSG